MKKRLFLILIVTIFVTCKEDPQPKPRAFLALEYPPAEYTPVSLNCPFSFEKNKIARIRPSRNPHPCWFNLEYPALDGTIFITYKSVDNNLRELLMDAQKMPLEHTIKASGIDGKTYVDKRHGVYGTFYEVTGDAASQAQFYLTDSTHHFLTGSVYFNVTPNFDSIVPAAAYLKKDIRHLMESVRWK